MAPGDALTTAPGLPFHALLPYGREPTSMAFLSAPGTDRLYSGVTKRTASADRIRSRNCVQGAGGAASASWLYSGRFPISTMPSFNAGDASSASALATLR